MLRFMDSLNDLLKHRNLEQPSDMKSINDYLERELGFPFKLLDYPRHMTICVGNTKIAYHLRAMLPALTAYAAPTKKIHVRVDESLNI